MDTKRRAALKQTAVAVGLSFIVAAAAVAGAGSQAGQPPSVDPRLLDAKRLFDAMDYEAAVPALDRVITQLRAEAPGEPAAREVLATALEMKARARYGLGDQEGAKADFKALLAANPGHVLPPKVSPRVVAIYNDIKKATVGEFALALSPAEAELELDGARYVAAAGSIAILAGDHTLTAKRAGFRTATETFTVAPGSTQPVSLTLERVSAVLSIVTVPPAVEVIVDGALRGRTDTGPLQPQYAEWPAKLGLSPSSFSTPLVLTDLAPGSHLVEFRRDCYVRAQLPVVIDRPADFRIDPVRLERAVASVYVDSPVQGTNVFLDGAPRGGTPLSLDDVCEGPHTVELRSAYGRYVRRIEVRTGEKVSIQGILRPAFAILGVTGLPEGFRGPDIRLSLEQALAPLRTVTVFAPAAASVQQALKAESLSPGWLAFDRARRPIGSTAAAITGSARRDLSVRLSKALEAQGLAEITVAPGAVRSKLLVTLLAAGSGEPDVIEITLEDAESVAGVVSKVDAQMPLFRASAGLVLADALDAPGPVVVRATANPAGAKTVLAPGDAVVQVNGQPIGDSAAFNALLLQRKVDDRLQVDARDRTGAAKRAEVSVATEPRLVAMTDQTLLFNKLILDFRGRLTLATGNASEQSVARLNLAVALMRVGNYADAQDELARVVLPDGPGVSNGTVQYLLGLVAEALGQLPDAERAWKAATAAPGALLGEDGPLIKDLAERKLAALKLRGR
jgi:hypothetical protein